MKRGRRSLKKVLKDTLELKTEGEVFPILIAKLGDVKTIKDAVIGVSNLTEGKVSPTPVALRKMLRLGVKGGKIRSGSPLHTLTKITRGRPKGYSPFLGCTKDAAVAAAQA